MKKKNIEESLVWSLYDLIYPELEVKHKLLNVEKLKMFYIWIMPLHSIVICGKTLFSIEKEVFQFELSKLLFFIFFDVFKCVNYCGDKKSFLIILIV